MNFRMVINMLGRTLLCEAAVMSLPLLVAVLYGEYVIGFVITILITAALGVLSISIRPRTKAIYSGEGFLIVALSWIIISALGSLPFVISGSIPRYVDAFFETVSGFTTTGSTILTDVTAMGKADMFWRCFTHWIGGMGVLVFMLAVMPSISEEQPMYIMKAEVPGPTVGKLVPKIRRTARILYIIYVSLTLIQIVLLLFGDMSLYDAAIHAFSTAGTGGFSNRAESIAYYSPYVQYVIAVFMLIFATNFNLYYLILAGNLRSALRDEEAHWFYGIVIAATVLIAINIMPLLGDTESSFRHAFFQVSSLISSTGFATADFNSWTVFSQCMLLLMIFFGACAGSTGGGLKISRAVILLKSLSNEIKHLLHPRSVSVIKLNKRPVPTETLRSIYIFFAFEIAILFGGALLISIDGFDLTTTFTAALTCFSNAGPGLGLIGPVGNFAAFSPFSKVVLCICMLLGRLEIFPIAMLFSPIAWKR